MQQAKTCNSPLYAPPRHHLVRSQIQQEAKYHTCHPGISEETITSLYPAPVLDVANDHYRHSADSHLPQSRSQN